MRRVLLSFVLLLCSIAPAEELPTITIAEGENAIELAVVNARSEAVSAIRLDIDEKNLPVWLTVDIPQESFDALSQFESESLVLRFTVTDAPDNAVLELPFTLRDTNGVLGDYAVQLEVARILPEQYDLFQNVPNPFNPSTTISYALMEQAHTRLVIYNSAGQKIRTLTDAVQNAGTHSVVWDGMNDAGAQVSSGMYFCRIEAGGFTKTMKMLLAR